MTPTLTLPRPDRGGNTPVPPSERGTIGGLNHYNLQTGARRSTLLWRRQCSLMQRRKYSTKAQAARQGGARAGADTDGREEPGAAGRCRNVKQTQQDENTGPPMRKTWPSPSPLGCRRIPKTGCCLTRIAWRPSPPMSATWRRCPIRSAKSSRCVPSRAASKWAGNGCRSA